MDLKGEVWIVDDDDSIRWVIERALEKGGLATRCFDRADKVIEALEESEPDVVISDIRMPGIDGFEFLQHVQVNHPALPVIIMTAYADLNRAVASFKGGAFEYVPKPFDIEELSEVVERALRKVNDEQNLGSLGNGKGQPQMLGSAPAMQNVFRTIGRLSNSVMTVLVTGESGVGKELVARALHDNSPRSNESFIALNTAAIPKELLESELFGHEKGSFTVATARRVGRFEQAEAGTLFLDEIGDMPPDLQTRLLRVLADGAFYRVGGRDLVKVDVRVVAATNQNLEQRVKEGHFREDLFHRLNVIRLHLPPLRERMEDLTALAWFFLGEAAQDIGVEPKKFSNNAIDRMMQYSWPGNVRELQNVCRRVAVMSPSALVEEQDLPMDILGKSDENADAIDIPPAEMDWETPLRKWAENSLDNRQEPLLPDAIPRLEKILIDVVATRTLGRRQDAARLLGWGRNTLTRKIKELGIEV